MTTPELLIAEMVTTQRLEDWSANVSAQAVRAIADTFTLGVAGLFTEQTRMLRSTVSTASGGESVRTWDGDELYAVADAALIQGVACHCLDWDDYMHPMHGHCSAVILPAAWSLAETASMSGRELVEAFLVGYQTNYALSLAFGAAHYEHGWHATSTIGAVGAAAAASRVLGLDRERTNHALGIASSTSAGLRVNFGTDTKSLHAGFAARCGVQAAQLAQAGLQASPRWLSGDYGMLATYGGEVPSDEIGLAITADALAVHALETPWGLVQKPYACCGSCHAALDAVIELSRQVESGGDTISEIEVHVDPMVPGIMRETDPRDETSARYCLPWAVAVAALDGEAGPAQFSSAALQRQDVDALRHKVKIIGDRPASDHDRFAAHVVVHTAGRTHEKTVSHGTGHPSNPLTDAQSLAKQRQAIAPVLEAEAVDRVVATLTDIVALPQISQLSDVVREGASAH